MWHRPLTELEGCVLGILSTLGPCTAYLVRCQFLESPSPYWSGSAGAIYPLLRRLVRRGLVQERRRSEGRRKSLLLSLTAGGRAALASWLLPPLPDLVIGVPSDPLRTRFGFLGALDARQRRAFLADASRRLAAHHADIEADEQRHRARRDRVNALLAAGARRMQEARLAWLREAARALGAPETAHPRAPAARRAGPHRAGGRAAPASARRRRSG